MSNLPEIDGYYMPFTGGAVGEIAQLQAFFGLDTPNQVIITALKLLKASVPCVEVDGTITMILANESTIPPRIIKHQLGEKK